MPKLLSKGEWQRRVDLAHFECQKNQFLVLAFKKGIDKAVAAMKPKRAGHWCKSQQYNQTLCQTELRNPSGSEKEEAYKEAKSLLKESAARLKSLKAASHK